MKDTDSLGEQIQRAFPDALVVKTLNTMTVALQSEPAQLAGGDHSVFVSGDDPDAKTAVSVLLESLGHTDVIDLGDITTARGTEMYLPLLVASVGLAGHTIPQHQGRALTMHPLRPGRARQLPRRVRRQHREPDPTARAN